jgi:hypothetical protein
VIRNFQPVMMLALLCPAAPPHHGSHHHIAHTVTYNRSGDFAEQGPLCKGHASQSTRVAATCCITLHVWRFHPDMQPGNIGRQTILLVCEYVDTCCRQPTACQVDGRPSTMLHANIWQVCHDVELCCGGAHLCGAAGQAGTGCIDWVMAGATTSPACS